MARKKAKTGPPLPPRNGLGASRARVPEGGAVTAWDFLGEIIAQQRYRHPLDDASALRDRFEAGEVVLRDATPVAPDTPLSPGTDIFFYRRPAPEIPVPYDIHTIYEDEDILVVNKPPFLATMPRAAHITESATVRLRRATRNEELAPAHRLDRLTAGLLLLTKRRELRGAYQELFAQRLVHKLYEAVAPDRGLEAPARWEHHIVKHHGEIASRIVPGAEPNSFTVLRDVTALTDSRWGDGLARYLLQPETGRTHQLRGQMNAAGVPIVGDAVYPHTRPFGDEDFFSPMLLASVGLAFPDPISGTPRRFTAPGYSGLPVDV